ncbi:unnamed protein product [Pleuronectes platessa]|uniref:Uncharacterized protein n=1 Tax=Pleuronectes platessa TaxID=8262 RepID=A0A9N7UMM2_PLEPL|nr:unnamed protein product [Pleuronectes platessa]
MDQIEERLAVEDRKYDHLYNPSLAEYNSWKDISANVGLQVDEALTCQLSLGTPPCPSERRHAPPTQSDAVESHCQQSAPGQGGGRVGTYKSQCDPAAVYLS